MLTFIKPNKFIMKKLSLFYKLAFICIILFYSGIHATAQTNPKPFVVPELTSWIGSEGYFSPSFRVAADMSDSKMKDIAVKFAADYKAITGVDLKLIKGKGKKGDFVLSIVNDDALGTEGYNIKINEKVEVSANSYQGVFWATRTLLQLTEQHTDYKLPNGEVTDIPQYALRGFMIDCGRKYIPIEYLSKLVEVMAYYKMNTLQIHLNDNGFKQFFDNDWMKTQSAFRLECETYPGLTAKDGSYTKDEFIDLQIFAESNYIEIIPEIDVPAHALAFTHYKPEIASEDYGMDHLDIFNPETYTFVDALFKEYLQGENPVFRGKRFHIGTDEYSNAKQEVVEKFRYFTDYYIRYVEQFGKQAVVWGALTHAKGETPVKSDDVLMYAWSKDYINPFDMKDEGYKLVSIPDGLLYIVPAAGYYYDYLNIEYLYNKWTPAMIGNFQFEENDPAIEGGMFALWNDHVGNGISVKDIHHRVYPALQTIATKCWTASYTTLPFNEFDSLRYILSEAPNVNELARYKSKTTNKWSNDNEIVLQIQDISPNSEFEMEEIGYNYSVSFDIECKEEDKGTVLFESANAVFYLSDPKDGRLGFSREGYLNSFNYSLPVGKSLNIKIEGDNKKTTLYVNGNKIQELGPVTVYALNSDKKMDFQYGDDNIFKPEMYIPNGRMFYQRTLVFPLKKSGNFNSVISNLKVQNYID